MTTYETLTVPARDVRVGDELESCGGWVSVISVVTRQPDGAIVARISNDVAMLFGPAYKLIIRRAVAEPVAPVPAAGEYVPKAQQFEREFAARHVGVMRVIYDDLIACERALADAVRDLELGRDERRRFEAGLAAKMGAKYGDNLFVQAERIVGERDAARAALAEVRSKFGRDHQLGDQVVMVTLDEDRGISVSPATAAALRAAQEAGRG